MIRTAITYLWTILASLGMGIAAIIAAYLTGSGNTSHRIARNWARSILWVSGVKVAVDGLENIQMHRSAVYMANHQSNFDIPVLLAHLPVQFRWLAKAELFSIPIFGNAMRKTGYISIDRSNQDSAFKSIDRAADIIRGGVSVLVFPEGTRSLDGRIRPFKKGGFVLTVDAGVPIVPVVIHGTWHIMPKDQFSIKPRMVAMHILAPVETSGYNRNNKDDLMNRIHRTICEHFRKFEEEQSCS